MNKLFQIVNALGIDDHQTSYDEYRDWCEEAGEEAYPIDYRYSLSELDQKWVILGAMVRQVADDPDAETVSSEHILSAMVNSSVPPSLEGRIETFCERVLREYQRSEALRPA